MHLLPSFLKTVSCWCLFVIELGGADLAARWANDALGWMLEVHTAGKGTQILDRETPCFLQSLVANRDRLMDAGLDRERLDQVWAIFTPITHKD